MTVLPDLERVLKELQPNNKPIVLSFIFPVMLRVATSIPSKTSSIRIFSRNFTHGGKKVAIVLSGCGVHDGTEIHEAVSALISVSTTGAQYKCFAPNIDQLHVINHVVGQVAEGEKRNVLVESARISRGEISDLAHLSSKLFDALIIPGGFGVAKNLSTYATQQENMTVLPDLERVLKEFHAEKKPIGLSCISPVIAAKVFPGCTVTIGNDAETVKVITALGSKNVTKKVDEVQIDKENLLVTTPAYMIQQQPIHKIYEGVTRMVKNVMQLTREEDL